jgi:hypothetical protein
VADAKHQTSPSLIDDLTKARLGDTRCGVAKILEQLDGAEREKLLETIDNTMVSAIDIARILKSHGFKASDKMIYRHRKRSDGGCGCPR